MMYLAFVIRFCLFIWRSTGGIIIRILNRLFKFISGITWVSGWTLSRTWLGGCIIFTLSYSDITGNAFGFDKTTAQCMLLLVLKLLGLQRKSYELCVLDHNGRECMWCIRKRNCLWHKCYWMLLYIILGWWLAGQNNYRLCSICSIHTFWRRRKWVDWQWGACWNYCSHRLWWCSSTRS